MTPKTYTELHAGPDPLLTAAEVAALFRVSTKTVGRWGRSGALRLFRTVGGHHRYKLSDICEFLGVEPTELVQPASGSATSAHS